LRAALLLALSFAGAALAQGDAVLPKVFVTRIDPGLQPAHSLQLDGTTLVHTIHFGADIETRRITPSTVQWAAFRRALDEHKVWRWRPNYRAGAAGTSWSLKIEYPDRSMASAGVGAVPDPAEDAALPKYPFTRYQLALQDLIGQPFVRPVSPTEAFDVEDLTLVSTHSSRKEPEQWADFRDPRGNVHRVRVGERVGAFGKLERVGRSSVGLTVLLKEGEEQQRTVKLARRKPAPK